jgi:hypothetical protein
VDAVGEVGLAVQEAEDEGAGAMEEAAFGEVGEAGGVGFGGSGGAEDAVVAGQFAFLAEAFFEPDHGGVEGEED